MKDKLKKMDSSPLVSVLMSFYNERIDFLKLSIESILNQSYTNIEFIILSDNPENISLNTYVEELTDSRIIFIKNEKNIGLTKTLNRGLGQCRGKYIVRMDADDIALPRRIETQVKFMEAHPDIMASGGAVIAINAKGQSLYKIKMPTNTLLMPYYSLFSSPLIHPASIIRRSDQQFYYNEYFRYAQDYALWVSFLGQGCNLSNIDEVILKYRYSENQIFKKHKKEQTECADEILRATFVNLNIRIDDFGIVAWKKINSTEIISAEEFVKLEEFIIDFYEKNRIIISDFGLDYTLNRLVLNLFLKYRGNNIFKTMKKYTSLLIKTNCSFKIKFYCLVLYNAIKNSHV